MNGIERISIPGRSRLGLLLVLVVALMGVFAGSSSSASAATCPGSSIKGEGSSLQGSAQTTWSGKFLTSKGCTVTYTSTSSGTGLKAWGSTGLNGFNETAALGGPDAYIGTDDAATTEQIENIEEASGSEVLVIPVTQAAVSIYANPPANCEVGEITNLDLEKVFAGEYAEWSDITTSKDASGHPTACNSAITRVVRQDNSGTSYQLKHYLHEIAEEVAPEYELCGNRAGENWEDLQASTKNTLWPEGGCALTTVKHSLKGGTGPELGSGGGDEAKTVNHTPGGIGYVALADAESNLVPGTTAILDVQNNGVENGAGAEFVSPAEGMNSNCEGVNYNVPALALMGATNVVWSEVYGSSPTMGNPELYPICTLTYDVSLNHYAATPELTSGEEQTASEYLNYVVSEEGQENNNNKFYAKLPSAEGSAQEAAIETAASIGL